MTYSENADAMLDALSRTPNFARVAGDVLDAETLNAILGEAAKVAESAVAPVGPISDRVGARFADGRVTLPSEYGPAWDALAEGGWLGLEHEERFGGMGMPLSVFAAVNPLFERACAPFMMCAGGSRSAALLLSAWADAELRDDWVPALVAGERCATICISEPEAGSDVGRIRTRAEKGPDGWQVSGQKIWISFGDHDLRDRIGHCMLARTGDAPGTRGLSLFFVERGPGVICERIEEKMGLHGSPTCALRFEDAPAVLIGEEGRGLPQLFTMIRHMRLSVATQGLGIALGSYDVAREHAESRRQGGDPKAPAVPIIQHADVQRQLMAMKSRIDLFRLALVEAACAADLSGDDPDMARLCSWLLPLIKNFGAEMGFDCAHAAIQVLGGAGFTKDYPVEQYLRDARVFTIYEGTTGMQGQDFLLRQTLAEDGAAVKVFLKIAAAECAEHTGALAVVERFGAFAEEVTDADKARLPGMADAFLRAGWVAVQAWLSVRIAETGEAAFFRATAAAELELRIAAARAA
ncbi:acyl-CoA dehydrogenase family protein [Pseudoruegeria sp. HB172150]|uniref:acyl-CoA dehydrogenase family protein n=1 Tax=Pseudoruegeria sp. HB172150 TaxID=2721164 RepID=UPI001551CB6F|nr:acyl-CoA dehydrogenase family protein [Pseudoruegeria sp. HB172150]